LRTDTRLQAPRETESHDLDLLLSGDPYKWLGDQAPAPPDTDTLTGVLAETLGPTAFPYPCAIARFPTIHPRLTEQIGGAVTTEAGVIVRNEDTYAAISRLPWMRRGRIPDWLRRALILRMSPQDGERVRGVWVRALEAEAAGAENPLVLDVYRP